ncbi:MAG: TatD family nuclease-associated radical SAM protein [Burkholderiaceae bacterium]|nr:TatD family nuclease-associated radical SAM protein [Burkholderiaceae bacterium]
MPEGKTTPAAIAYTLHGSRYLNVTSRCSLRCAFCPRYNNHWVVGGYNMRMLRKDEPTADALVNEAGNPLDFNEVVFCGLGEATVRLDVVLDVARRLRAKGARLRLNTNGLANLVHGRDVTKELFPLIQTVSISLNAQNEDVYNRHCRPKRSGSYAAMLEFIRLARDAGADVTVTAIDGLEGVDISACEKIALDLGVKFRRRVLDDVA